MMLFCKKKNNEYDEIPCTQFICLQRHLYKTHNWKIKEGGTE